MKDNDVKRVLNTLAEIIEYHREEGNTQAEADFQRAFDIVFEELG